MAVCLYDTWHEAGIPTLPYLGDDTAAQPDNASVRFAGIIIIIALQSTSLCFAKQRDDLGEVVGD